jgi:SAM-dependent methyltransferase
MKSSFGLYSRYYDLLYQDKDYAAETEYIRKLITQFCPDACQILELGCGTGKHAALLAESGWQVTGVERSAEMIKAAQDAAQDTDDDVTIVCGDARSVRLDDRFDAVVSLFHVVSYQETNADVAAMFETASSHLHPGGCFLFDLWYGPAVLRQLPESRVKEMEDDQTKVLRQANPIVNFHRNLVDVNYEITITDKKTGTIQELQECHRMRYFFAPEIELFAQSAGMTVVHSEQWLSGAKPSAETWGVAFVLKKTI